MTQRDLNDSTPILIYQTQDDQTRLEVRLENETVWLTQSQMAELFQTTKQNVSLHIQNAFEEKELERVSTVKESLTVQKEGPREVKRKVDYYNLDVIISVGYRVHSNRGIQFRQWATQRLREHIVKGFTLDDDRFKRMGGSRYFEELLARIRDIRSSEKVFWRKVLDIYATSIDYDPNNDPSKQFFAVVQNKMHWAAHGHTAAEIIHDRADAEKPHMGMTNWAGDRPIQSDVEVGKNYLNHKEIEALNRIVNSYLEFAEVRAMNRMPMTMKDWTAKLDDFLKLGDRAILSHAGRVSRDAALAKAAIEYEKYHTKELLKPSPVEGHFMEAVKKAKRLGSREAEEKPPTGPKGRAKAAKRRKRRPKA